MAMLVRMMKIVKKMSLKLFPSPQRWQSWLQEVQMYLSEELVDAGSTAFMLILDVKTRWSSTHQMLHKWFLGQALQHHEAINTYIYQHEDLIQHHLTKQDWRAIKMVTRWLKSFQSATTQMLATKKPMISSTHTIFHGLQAEIRDILCEEQGLSPQLVQGLSDAHLKLSEYYYKFDESPFYLWASFLDPHISYSALLDKFEGDEDLAPFLKVAKNKLHRILTLVIQFSGAFTAELLFPTVSACISLSSSASAVAVERIFSGGQDTISLHHASLKVETIRTLMLVKKKLHLQRERVVSVV
ncbi:ribonuclease H-like domain-containing protein [Russula earlei]|uniref:Ribonuclease H-like domain-containing protein n=1 Tax=Russula earlei TaxID=71964 RepID=A0ACC0U5Y1_9AGAM|nr:ribonuclease H-like domain-containing protein [Russula earlei]